LEHEVGWEAVQIALDCLIEGFCPNAIKLRQVGVEDDLLLAQVMDQRRDLLGAEQDAGSAGLQGAG